jgi:hypothetical protein
MRRKYRCPAPARSEEGLRPPMVAMAATPWPDPGSECAQGLHHQWPVLLHIREGRVEGRRDDVRREWHGWLPEESGRYRRAIYHDGDNLEHGLPPIAHRRGRGRHRRHWRRAQFLRLGGLDLLWDAGPSGPGTPLLFPIVGRLKATLCDTGKTFPCPGMASPGTGTSPGSRGLPPLAPWECGTTRPAAPPIPSLRAASGLHPDSSFPRMDISRAILGRPPPASLACIRLSAGPGAGS